MERRLRPGKKSEKHRQTDQDETEAEREGGMGESRGQCCDEGWAAGGGLDAAVHHGQVLGNAGRTAPAP